MAILAQFAFTQPTCACPCMCTQAHAYTTLHWAGPQNAYRCDYMYVAARGLPASHSMYDVHCNTLHVSIFPLRNFSQYRITQSLKFRLSSKFSSVCMIYNLKEAVLICFAIGNSLHVPIHACAFTHTHTLHYTERALKMPMWLHVCSCPWPACQPQRVCAL